MKRSILAAGVSFVCLAVAALVVIAVESAGSPPRKYDPHGLSAEQAEKLPAEKRERWEQLQREYDEAVAKGLPTASNPNHILKPREEKRYPSEIVEGQSIMGNDWANGWRGVIGDKNVLVYAGTRYDNRGDGYISVIRSEFDGTRTRGNVQVVPGAGSLRVVKADGFVLSLVSDSGETYQFDVESEQLLSTAPCCSLQLDFDQAEPGIQASQAVAVGVITSIGVVLGESVADLSSLQFTIIYDDTLLVPILGEAGTINGNPTSTKVRSAPAGHAHCLRVPARRTAIRRRARATESHRLRALRRIRPQRLRVRP